MPDGEPAPPPSPGPLRRLTGFGVAPLVASLSPLLVLPLLARLLTTGEWASVAIGQSVGGLGALMIGMGWSVAGPAEIARAGDAERRLLLAESLWSRGSVAPVVLLLSCAAAAAIPGATSPWLAAATAFAAACQGFSLAWYAIGVGRSSLLIGYEAVPRLAGSLAGVAAVAALGTAVLFPLALLGSMLVPWLLFWRHAVPRAVLRAGRRGVVVRLRCNVAAMATETVAGAYSVGASALVGGVASPAAVATFNAGERLTRFGSQGIGAAGAALQGWVAEATGRRFVRRVASSALTQLLIGGTGLVVLALAGPALTGLLFGDRLRIDRPTGIALGIFFLLWAVETVTGRHVLAARQRTGALLATTAAGSVVGVVAIVGGAIHAGAAGGAAGLASGIAVIVALQTLPVAQILRHEWDHDPAGRSR